MPGAHSSPRGPTVESSFKQRCLALSLSLPLDGSPFPVRRGGANNSKQRGPHDPAPPLRVVGGSFQLGQILPVLEASLGRLASRSSNQYISCSLPSASPPNPRLFTLHQHDLGRCYSCTPVGGILTSLSTAALLRSIP